MDIFNKEKIARLEDELEIYKSRCEALERNAKSVKDLELKVKCLQMWCDDDEAIDELMTAVKSKDTDQRERNYRVAMASEHRAMSAMGQASMDSNLRQWQQGEMLGRTWEGGYK